MTGADDHDDPWAELLADAEALGEEYREAGWETVVVDPTDVTVVEQGERTGLNALVTDDEYEPVAAVVERDEAAFEGADVYRRQAGATTDAIAVELDGETETAVVVPLSYDLEDARPVLETALEAGELLVHVRPPSIADGWITFAHDEPSLFVGDALED